MKVRAVELEVLQKKNIETHKSEKITAMDWAGNYYKRNGRKGIRKYLREHFQTLTRNELTEVIGYWDAYFS